MKESYHENKGRGGGKTIEKFVLGFNVTLSLQKQLSNLDFKYKQTKYLSGMT